MFLINSPEFELYELIREREPELTHREVLKIVYKVMYSKDKLDRNKK